MGGNDAELVIIRNHDRDPNLAYLDTPPTLSSTMGRFRPARFVGARNGAYVVRLDQLAAFERFAATSGIVLLDKRGALATDRPYGREHPLPECALCGQPAKRGARFRYCPACGEEWHPIEPVPVADADALTIQCESCGRRQTRGFAHCGHCGVELDADPEDPDPFLRGPRRERLDEPVAIGAVLQELPLDLPPTP
jgi:hypothetical protein